MKDALSIAAQVWCRDDTKRCKFDGVLCTAFAETLEPYLNALKAAESFMYEYQNGSKECFINEAMQKFELHLKELGGEKW